MAKFMDEKKELPWRKRNRDKKMLLAAVLQKMDPKTDIYEVIKKKGHEFDKK